MTLNPVSFAKPRETAPRLSPKYVSGKHAARFWTQAEDAILRDAWPKGGLAATQPRLPGRTRAGIYQRVRHLGLQAEHKTPRGRGRPKPDDETIRAGWAELQGKGAVADFAERLGVARPWLSERAEKLGLTIPHKKEPRWSEAEVALLAKAPLHALDRAAALFAEHGFRRSPTSIAVRAKRVGLSRRAARPELSATGAASILGVDVKVVTALIIEGRLKATKRADRRSPQQGGSAWDILAADLRAYVFENPERIDLRKVDRIPFLALLGGEEFKLTAAPQAISPSPFVRPW